jgi:hypothetical protein
MYIYAVVNILECHVTCCEHCFKFEIKSPKENEIYNISFLSADINKTSYVYSTRKVFFFFKFCYLFKELSGFKYFKVYLVP